MARFAFRKRNPDKARTIRSRRNPCNPSKRHRRTEPVALLASRNKTSKSLECGTIGYHRKAVDHLAAAPSLLIGFLLVVSATLFDFIRRGTGILTRLQISNLFFGIRGAAVHVYRWLQDKLKRTPTEELLEADTEVALNVGHRTDDSKQYSRRRRRSHKSCIPPDQITGPEQSKRRSLEPARYNPSTGCCVRDDGSPTPVPPGDCASVVPRHYREMHGPDAGRRAWEATQDWRLRHGVWNIHARPLLTRDGRRCPLYLHGFTKDGGHPVLYESTAQLDLGTVPGDGAAKVEALLRQFVSQLEYLANVVERPSAVDDTAPVRGSSSWGFVYVMDVRGVGWGDLLANAPLKLRALELLALHYPRNCRRVVVANVPNWLKSVAPTHLPSVERAGAQFETWTEAETLDNLSAMVDWNEIPPELGGASRYSLGQHPMDVAFQNLLLNGCAGDETVPGVLSDAATIPPLPTGPVPQGGDEGPAPTDRPIHVWRRWAKLPQQCCARVVQVPRSYLVRRTASNT